MKNKLMLIMLFILVLLIAQSSFSLFGCRVATTTSTNIAVWDVRLEQTGVNNNLMVVPEVSNATYTLNVKSLSDVDVKYDVVISNLLSGIEVSLDGVNFSQASNGTITFTNAGTIPHNSANNGIDSKTITFRGVSGAELANNHIVVVDVIAKQVVGS